MKVTTKADWFTKYLLEKGFWVGGTPVIHSFNSPCKATQTIRFFKSSKYEFLIVYILEFAEPFEKRTDYESAIRLYLESLEIKPSFTLAIWPHRILKFAILDKNRFTQELETNQVLLHFKKYDPYLVGQTSNLKPINRSFNDYFHKWARSYMKGFQNDIDCFIKPNEEIHMFELKRPKESVDTWKPYLADANNYIEFSNLCKQNFYRLTNIAYSQSEPGKVKIFKEVRYDSHQLNYLTAILKFQPEDNLLLSIDALEFKPERSAR